VCDLRVQGATYCTSFTWVLYKLRPRRSECGDRPMYADSFLVRQAGHGDDPRAAAGGAARLSPHSPSAPAPRRAGCNMAPAEPARDPRPLAGAGRPAWAAGGGQEPADGMTCYEGASLYRCKGRECFLPLWSASPCASYQLRCLRAFGIALLTCCRFSH
jgi:hypothetical protein